MTEKQTLPMDFWENVEEYREQYRESEQVEPAPGTTRSDLETAISELVEERTDDMWRVLSIIYADQSNQDGTMFLLVIRYGVGDSGDLLLDERYFVVDPRDPWREQTGFTQNGITRNLSGEGMLLALKVSYAAISDQSDRIAEMSPQYLEARNGKMVHNPDALLAELADLLGLPEREESGAICRRCEQPVDPDADGVECMSGDLGDIWVHVGGCPDE